MNNLHEIRAKLDDINQLIAPYKLAYVSPKDECLFLDKNAHYMEKETLERLTHNISQDGFLSQLPFGMKRQSDGKFLILSGNHRLKASIKAGLEFILILYIDEVDKSTQIAYQLSHNALVGKDDMRMLKEIYREIETVEAMEFSGLNGLNFLDFEKINAPAINDADIELTEMKFLFIQSRANEVKQVLEVLEKMKIGDDCALVVGDFEPYIELMTAIKKAYGVKSVSVAFNKMVEICAEKLRELEQ
ncbi:MAG: ParB N-terminal domain-containing protein [Chlorobiaceae bacterium]|nr:ParB N-terminal domain-containing protein [Chlorobiaceae bacterium]